MANSRTACYLQYRRGIRSRFWASEGCRVFILWLVVILSIVLIVLSTWPEDVKRIQERGIQEAGDIIAVRRGGLYTFDHTSENLNCTTPSIRNFPDGLFSSTQRRHGLVIINLMVALYMFVALAIICDEFFMPALQLICDDLRLKEDVAGATFMSVGGSAPELFASIIGVFIARGDIGVGTIVGSAVFNLLFVIGLCGLLAGKEILLTCWPLVRDSTCYLITIGALVLAVLDNTVHWYDATMLLLIYIAYLVLMYFNEDIEEFVSQLVHNHVKWQYKKSYDLERSLSNPGSEAAKLLNGHSGGSLNHLADNEMEEDDVLFNKKVDSLIEDEERPKSRRESKNSPDNNTEDDSSVFDVPDSCLKLIPWVLALPLLITFSLTIPNCKKDRWRRCYPVTFVISLLWIGVLTFILVWMVTVIGYDIGIHDTIMGLTLLAAGASTPDTILSIIAAREGYGDMAISHSIGSNLFDILVGLGCPWFIQTVILQMGSEVTIYSGAIVYISLLLLVNVIALVAVISYLNFKLNYKLGILLLLLYFVFITMSLLFEMNLVIPGLTLPICSLA